MKKAGSVLPVSMWGMAAVVSVLLIFAGSAFAEWRFGVGTGLQRMTMEGDLGFRSGLAGGPVTLKVDLDANDISDAVDSAMGFGVYATDGLWTLRGFYSSLDLEGRGTAGNVSADVDFDMTISELVLERVMWDVDFLYVNLLAGVRNTEHKLASRTTDGVTTADRKLDNDWTDFLVGASALVPLPGQWSWTTQANAGFGGSEGTYEMGTALNWRFLENWSASLNAKYTAVEFEDGAKGSPDWYLYDIDETRYGVSVYFTW